MHSCDCHNHLHPDAEYRNAECQNTEHQNTEHQNAEHQNAEHDTTKAYPQGMKWTRQRKDVYEVLREATEPLSALQIYQQVAKTDKSGSYAASTIYRILAAFEEKNIVSKTNWMGDGTVVYELNRGGHTHYAVCLDCHKRIQLPSCPFTHMQLEQETGDFTVTSHKLELYGYCKECKVTRMGK